VDGDDLRIEEFDGPLREWLAQGKVERQIQKRFARFLNHFPTGRTEDGQERPKVYPRRINDLCASACRARSGPHAHLCARAVLMRPRACRCRQRAEFGGVVPALVAL
jgi:hypothetical protein